MSEAKSKFPSGIAASLKRISSKIRKGLNRKRDDVAPVRLFVAAFGKHPGWDDHMEDIGLETDVLSTAKRILYYEGIQGNLENKEAWPDLEDKGLLREYRHQFIWAIGGEVVVGRMWSSRDGKGRTAYPMIVCVQCSGLALEWAVRNILPRLEELERVCTEDEASADEVRRAIENAQTEFRRLAQQDQPSEIRGVECPSALAKLVGQPGMGPDYEGLLRILYWMDREGVGICQVPGKTVFVQQRAHARVPAATGLQREAALLWVDFILGRLGAKTSVLVLMPLGESWMDVIAGGPTPAELYCIRAPSEGPSEAKVVPVTSSVEFNIDAVFLERIGSLLTGLPRGDN